MKKFDVQSRVRVKLNIRGIEILRHRHEKMVSSNLNMRELMGDFHLPKVDSEGYTEFDLSDLMEIFGPYIKLGEDFPFDREIQIEEKELKDVPSFKR